MNRPRLFSIRRRSEPGAAPGTLIAPPNAPPPIIDIVTYTKESNVEHQNISIDALEKISAQPGVTWVNVIGLGDTSRIEEIATFFGLHHLALEDVLNLHQRPKLEEYDDHLFIVVRMVAQSASTDTEQVAIFLGKDFVLTIQEKSGDCFDPVRARARNVKSRLRGRGADYLAYSLIDAVIDGYFPVLENLGEKLERLEDAIVGNAQPESISSLHAMKRQFLSLRRAVWPYRELLSTLSREEYSFLHKETRLYLRDCYDHVVQLMDLLETYREIASGLMDVYLSASSARLGEITKVLTVIATIFIPLSFIASLYGMNFDRSSQWNMPELGWRLGYPFALALMGLCAAAMVGYFWLHGWLGGRRRFDVEHRRKSQE
jgi:magnesium transporter